MKLRRVAYVGLVLVGTVPGVSGCPGTEDLVAVRSTETLEGGLCGEVASLPAATAEDLDALFATNLDWSLCVCEGGVLAEPLVVGALGGVSFAARLECTSPVDVAGDLVIDGGLLLATGTSKVGGSLRMSGDLDGFGADLEVGGDAYLGGDLFIDGWAVGGEFVMNPGAAQNTAFEPQRAVVPEPETCNCDALPTALVEALSAQPTQELALVTSADGQNQLLQCGGLGRWAAPSESPTNLEIAGAGFIVVDGRLAVEGDLQITVPAGEELSVIFSGGLHVLGALGTEPDGGRVRVYIPGSGALDIGSALAVDTEQAGEQGVSFHGQLLAPELEVAVYSPWAVAGNLWLKRLALHERLELTD